MVDEQQIGQYVGRGLQHTVYTYGANQVIKIPHAWMRFVSSYKAKKDELALTKKYLGAYMPDTDVMPFRNSYCYIQKNMCGLPPLTLSHVQPHDKELVALLRENKKLMKERGLSADVLGARAYVDMLARHIRHKPVISANIVRDTSTNALYLLDTDLLRTSVLHNRTYRDIPFAVLSFCVYVLNALVLKHYKVETTAHI